MQYSWNSQKQIIKTTCREEFVQERMKGLFIFLKLVPWLYIHICLVFSIKKIRERSHRAIKKMRHSLNVLHGRNTRRAFHLLAFWKNKTQKSKEQWLPEGVCEGVSSGGVSTWLSSLVMHLLTCIDCTGPRRALSSGRWCLCWAVTTPLWRTCAPKLL